MVDGSDAALGSDRDRAPAHASFRVEPGPPVVVHVAGELDADSSPMLRRHLDEAFGAGGPVVAVDLSELVFIDSVGLSVLVSGHNRSQADGVGFEVRNLPSGPRRIFEITGLVEVLDLR